MRTDLFDFELPPGRIALRPASPRDAARLLVVRPDGTLEDRAVRDLPRLLAAGDQVVVNNTKVIPATLHGRRIGRAGTEPAIAATLHQRIDGSHWRAFVKPARKLAAGDVVRFGEEGKVCFLGQLDATVAGKGEGGEVTLSFTFHGPVLDQAIEERGDMPLPPYIASRRPADERDRSDYQTLFARHEGSVAAPTAGLHFTDELVAALAARGIGLHKVTLPVGAGTRARHGPAQGPAPGGRRPFPAGQSRRYRGPSHARRARQRERGHRRRAQRRARRGQADRRDRQHVVAPARDRR